MPGNGGVGAAGSVGMSGAVGTQQGGSNQQGGVAGSSLGGSSSGGAGSGGSSGNAGSSGMGPAVSCKPPDDVFSPIERLSQTGCMDSKNLRSPVAGAIAYEVNSPLWSDVADKTRAFVLPAGTKIHVRRCSTASDCPGGLGDDGRWDFPVGSVMIKNFLFDDKVVETRLFMHLVADDWVGYSYAWNEAQTEAELVASSGATSTFKTGARDVAWHYPSQDDCVNCHNRATGSTIGPETAQMNRVVAGVNQIDKLTALGVFDVPPDKPYKAALVTPYDPPGSAPTAGTVEQKARSYLHANCGFCHRPGANFPNFDLRYDTSLKNTSTCDADVKKGALASAPGKTKILVPGHETDSVLWLRMKESDPQKGRMPQIGTYEIDAAGAEIVGQWIRGLAACPG